MTTSSVGNIGTAEEYLDFGAQVGHHGTVPREPEEGRLFSQVLKLRRTASGATAGEPTVLLWSGSRGYVNAFWFDGNKLGDVCSILRGCEGLELDAMLEYRAYEVTRVGNRNFLEGRMGLRELIDRRHET